MILARQLMERLTFLLPIIFGLCFVFLGRWLYLNPSKLFPGWGLLNPEHPRVKKISRVYATLLIFVGTFASVAATFALIPSVSGMALLALPAAVVAAWLLRPRVPQSEFSVAADGVKPGSQPLLTQRWKRNLAIAGGFAVVFGVVLFAVVSVTFRDSDVSRMAVAAAESNPIVQEKLGNPLKVGLLTSGSMEISGQSGHADLSLPVRGPKGKGTIYAVARKSGGLWKFESLDIAFEETKTRMTLLKESADPPNP